MFLVAMLASIADLLTNYTLSVIDYTPHNISRQQAIVHYSPSSLSSIIDTFTIYTYCDAQPLLIRLRMVIYSRYARIRHCRRRLHCTVLVFTATSPTINLCYRSPGNYAIKLEYNQSFQSLFKFCE